MNDDIQADNTASNENDRRSEDGLWKELLQGFFHDMLRSVLPGMAKEADPEKPVRFFDTELRRLARFTRRYSESPPDSRKFAWKEWESELDKRKEEGGMYVSLMERKGIEKGIEQGIVQGIEKGILRGKTEMIREMLRWGDSDEKILACARITPEELAALKEQFRREAN